MRLLLLILLSLFAMTSSQSAAQAENGSFEGTVVRMSTGEPMPGVQVQMSPYGALTDRDGHFRIENIAPQNYAVMVQLPGFIAAGLGPSIGNNGAAIGRITIAAREQIKDFRVELVATGTISGRVSGADGAPIPNLVMQGLRRAYIDGQSRVAPFNLPAVTRTDDRGEYRVYGLPPGEYYISVMAPAAAATAGTVGLIPTYFPGTRDPDKAAPVVVKEGAETPRVDFIMQSGIAPTITGFVIPYSPEAPVTQLSVGPVPRTSGASLVTNYGFSFDPKTTPPGQFVIRSFPLAPGPYDLFVSATGRDMDYFGSVPIEVADRPLVGVAVPVHPGMEVGGHLTIRGNAADLKLTGPPITLRSMTYSTTARVNNLQVANLLASARTGATTTADLIAADLAIAASAAPGVGADGNFSFRSLPPGRFIIAPSLPQGACLLDVLHAGKSILDSGLTVGSTKPEPIEVIIGAQCAKVEGVIQDGNRPRGLKRVVLIPSEPHRHSYGLYRLLAADQRGQFSFDGVPPGAYKLFAWRSIPDNGWTDAKYLMPYEDRGTAVEVPEGGIKKDLKVQLILD